MSVQREELLRLVDRERPFVAELAVRPTIKQG